MTIDELICPECGSSKCIEVGTIGECIDCDNIWELEPAAQEGLNED